MSAPFVWAEESARNARTFRALYLRRCRDARQVLSRQERRAGERRKAARELVYARIGLLGIRVSRERDERGRPPARRLRELRYERNLAELDVLRIRLTWLREDWRAARDDTARSRLRPLGRTITARLDSLKQAIEAAA